MTTEMKPLDNRCSSPVKTAAALASDDVAEAFNCDSAQNTRTVDKGVRIAFFHLTFIFPFCLILISGDGEEI